MLYFGDKLEPIAISKQFPHHVKTLGLFFFFPKKVFVSIPLALFFLAAMQKLSRNTLPLLSKNSAPNKKRNQLHNLLTYLQS
jgi:hypothetical protein